MLLKLLTLGGLGYAGYRYYEKNKSQPAFSGRKWTQADEESDQSFPASDPPANY